MLTISLKKIQPQGMSLVEVILAIALFGLLATALIGLLMASYGSDVQASQRDIALLHAQEGMEAVMSIRRQAWNLLKNGNHGLDNAGGYWEFSGVDETIDGSYIRTVNIADACRDGSNNIVDCSTSGLITDVHTKKVTVGVNYTSINGINNSVELVAYLTTWQTQDWVQTDWVGGGGQTIWSSAARFSTSDGNVDTNTSGQITLAAIPGTGCGDKVWDFAAAGNYLYDTNAIQVTQGVAQLLGSEEAAFGLTVNPDFDFNADGWSYDDWDQGGGEVDVEGIYQSSGGNPGGYLGINFPGNSRNDELGGYWVQPFTTTIDNPVATIDFDWLVSQYDAMPNTFQLYVFVDSFSGDPIIGQEIWSSGEISSTQSWTSQFNINASAKVAAPGTYYLKIAVWLETPGGPGKGPYYIGYDNVELDWREASSYPSNNPSISPTSPYVPSAVSTWSSFTETAIKNGGEIYYQLSDDNASTWQYWNGSSWVIAGANDYNPASVVNANIQSFPTTNGQLSFKAFLASDGNQQIELDEVKVSCAKSYDWTFDAAGDYVYDTNKIEVTGGMVRLILGNLIACVGTPTACSALGDQAGCEDQAGCNWSFGGGSCSNVGSCAAAPPNQCNNQCSSAGCDKVGPNCTGTLNCLVFTNQASCQACGQCSWTEGSFACVGTPTACSALGDQAGCEDQAGCNWSTESYPIDRPIIQTSTSHTVSNLTSWSSFTETAIKNGGEIYYQLSDDNASTWQYWNGSSWVIAGANDYNPASVVNANIQSFPTTNGQLSFKAFLASDGNQQIELDNLKISWSEDSQYGGGYQTFGYLVSSAFNMGNRASVHIIEWDQIIPSCSPSCEIKTQIRTAPDSGGLPGTWTGWHGANGAGTYFTDSAGAIISTDLNDNQWMQYRVELAGDGIDTPILKEVKINYLP